MKLTKEESYYVATIAMAINRENLKFSKRIIYTYVFLLWLKIISVYWFIRDIKWYSDKLDIPTLYKWLRLN